MKIQNLIEYLEKTNSNDWIVDKVRTENGKGCLMSHIFDWGGGDNGGSEAWDWFEECWATTYMVYPVNDKQHPKYQQSDPKERCIAYLKDLQNGSEKTTQDYFNEYQVKINNK